MGSFFTRDITLSFNRAKEKSPPSLADFKRKFCDILYLFTALYFNHKKHHRKDYPNNDASSGYKGSGGNGGVHENGGACDGDDG
jgi:hypothetical protein